MANGNGKRNGKRLHGRDPNDQGNVGSRPNPIKHPHNWAKARETVYLWLRGEGKIACAELAGVSRTTFEHWRKCDWWWALVEEEGDLRVGARRTVGLQVLDRERAEAFRVLERVDDRLAPPKQRLEITQNYMHRDEVIELFRGLAQDLVDVVGDPEQRDEMVRRVERRLMPMAAQKALPPGEPEGEA